MIPKPSSIEKLVRSHALDLPHLLKARRRSEEVRSQLFGCLAPFHASDCSIVAFGSLARLELTSESDLDWTLLVDGPARAEHKPMALQIDRALADAGQKKPNPNGAFGSLTFSHDLVHAIGGDADTNKNTTRRILLLLESINLGSTVAWERVVNGVLDRYLTQEPYGATLRKEKRILPRFLLNDIVRFWRTMAVDYAAKVIDRGGDGWALRNAKLRLSRKLLFSAGLLLTYEIWLNPPEQECDLFGQPLMHAPAPLIRLLRELVDLPPLDILARAMERYGASSDSIRKVFVSYDRFLSILDDPRKRRRLNDLRYEEAFEDPVFDEVRETAVAFQEGLDAFFLDGPENVKNLTRRYAIF